MEQFAAYGPAIVALALWGLLILVLTIYSTFGRTAEARCDCGKPKRDYADPVYRRERAYMNAVETSGPFIATTLAAMLAGGAVFWVNLLAAVFVISRIAMAAIHIGTENQPMRSISFMVGFLVIIALGLIAVFAAL
ncbi:MAPEG family protein [Sulfitobacter sp. SK012]|uniref:MAPEG family protein n=1 Tax=Sulfitobacter sp. SK012 TaxID=1389005 RepID=UPI000E0A6F45|nr:MAPEG family protein [Sulfitobacter sp. SK012]AXI46081.1 MAPEG family protein [Sulfitobacter sp. SK012]